MLRVNKPLPVASVDARTQVERCRDARTGSVAGVGLIVRGLEAVFTLSIPPCVPPFLDRARFFRQASASNVVGAHRLEFRMQASLLCCIGSS